MVKNYAFKLESFARGDSSRGITALARAGVHRFGFAGIPLPFAKPRFAIAAAGTWAQGHDLADGPDALHLLTVYEVQGDVFTEVSWATVSCS